MKYLTRDFDLDDIKKQLKILIDNPEYHFYFNAHHIFDFSDLKLDGWNADLLAVKYNEKIIGFVKMIIERPINFISQISVLLYPSYLNSGIGVKVMLETLEYIFINRGFHKVMFTCVDGNKRAKKIYDRCILLGGRYIGYFKDHAVLFDNTLVNEHIWEITKKDYLESSHKIHLYDRAARCK